MVMEAMFFLFDSLFMLWDSFRNRVYGVVSQLQNKYEVLRGSENFFEVLYFRIKIPN